MCHADTYSRHRAGVRATVTSLCGKPPDRYAFPLWDVWDLPWTTRGRSVWAWRHCPCVGKICHVARSPCSLRPIQTMSLYPASSCHEHSWDLHVPVNSSLIRDGEDLKTDARAFSPLSTAVKRSPFVSPMHKRGVPLKGQPVSTRHRGTQRAPRAQATHRSKKEGRSPKEGRNANTNRKANPETRP